MVQAKGGQGHRAGTVETYDDLEAAVSGAGFVIEAATEDPDLKRKLLVQLDLLAAPDAIVASNSSSIPVSTLVSDLAHPERVLNVHFHNPPWVPAVDLLSSGKTRHEIIEYLEAELPKYGLVPFEANSQESGFPVNRLIEAFTREAIQIIVDGASTPEKVDAMWMVDMGMPYGPFGLMDVIGLDVVAHIERIRRHNNPVFENWKAVEALEPYLSAGKLGVKAGEGFFRYDEAGERID
jgi:3-hydroxybutyryl-CoA dehydrogenase